MKLRRINTMGREYELSAPEPYQTTITLNGVSITVDASLEQMNQAWYNWTMKGLNVQEAFRFLNPGQREFLLTGITEEQWNKIFSAEER